MEKTYTIDVHDSVSCLSFSPFEWSGSLLAIGTSSRISIVKCRFPEEDPDLDDMEYEWIKEYHHWSRVCAIAWSPQTSLIKIPKSLIFATTGGDKCLRVFSSDLKNDNVQTFEGHTSYINHIAFEPHSGEVLASVSDDFTCRIWSMDGKEKVRFFLESSGISVCWHCDEPDKLLVGEENGIIRLYDMVNTCPLTSLNCNCIPLRAAEWSPMNSLHVFCIAGPEWFLWDTSLSSWPLQHGMLKREGTCVLSICRTNENLFATRDCFSNKVKVTNWKLSQTVLKATLPGGSGLTCHFKFPLWAAGGNRKVQMWKIDTFQKPYLGDDRLSVA